MLSLPAVVIARRAHAAGGRVARQLPIIHGFAASIPGSALRLLAGDHAVVDVSPDIRVTLG